MTRLLPQAVPYLSPASRAQLFIWLTDPGGYAPGFMPSPAPQAGYKSWGSGLRSCDSQSTKLLRAHGHVGREFKLRPFSAGSILTLRKRIEPPASTTSVERTPRKIQSTKLTRSITAPGKCPNPRKRV